MGDVWVALAYNEGVTTYRAETSPDTVVCANCGEHGPRSETIFTAEGTLVCRRCSAIAAHVTVAPSPSIVRPPPPPERRSWGDLVLGACVPVPLYGVLWAALHLLLTMIGNADTAFGALFGAALVWPLAIVVAVWTARARHGRISFANGVVAAAILTLVVWAAGTLLVMSALAGAIRG